MLGFERYDTSIVLDIPVNTLRPRLYGRHFPDDIFLCIFLNENEWLSIKISLKFVPKVPISNIPSLVQIMAWRRPGDKPLCEPMMVVLPTHICVTRPQWVNAMIAWAIALRFSMMTPQSVNFWIRNYVQVNELTATSSNNQIDFMMENVGNYRLIWCRGSW